MRNLGYIEDRKIEWARSPQRNQNEWCPRKEDLQKILASQGKNQRASDERIRNSIEGKVGEAQRRFSLGRVMAKLSNTSETGNAITFLVMNLSALLRQAFWLFLCLFHNKNLFSCFLPLTISKDYVLLKILK